MRYRLLAFLCLLLFAGRAWSAFPLCGSNWFDVYEAAQKVEQGGRGSIVSLLEMMDDERYIPLEGTADLIYPGGKDFFGHGHMVDYPLNWLPTRAGWVLENITFEDFGFSVSSEERDRIWQLMGPMRARGDSEDQLDAFVKSDQLAKVVPRARNSRALAKAWWSRHENDWTRFRGIQNALNSDSAIRQYRALAFLRDTGNICEGLTLESFRKKLLARTVTLARSGNELPREQACLLLERLPNGRRFSISGAEPGQIQPQGTVRQFRVLPSDDTLHEEAVQVETLYCSKGKITEVVGDTLWEDGKPLISRGDTIREISDRLTPLRDAEVGHLICCVAENCNVTVYIDKGKVVNVELSTRYPGSVWGVKAP